MGDIRARVLRGWGQLWGTSGEPAQAPRRIAADSEIQPVYDVGPNAHAWSRWLRDGWGTTQLGTTHVGAGALQASLAVFTNVTATTVGWDRPAPNLHDTAVWLRAVTVTCDTPNNLLSWAVWVDNIGIDAASVRRSILIAGANGSTTSGGTPGLVSVLAPTDEALANGLISVVPDSYLPYRLQPPSGRIFLRTNASGAVDVSCHVLLWLGEDGLPPPGV